MYNLQGAFAAAVARRPLVWHIRELRTESFPARVMLRLVPMLATRVVATSNAVAASVPACGARLRMFNHGVDLSRFDVIPDVSGLREEFGLAEDTPVVVTIGRLEPWKGQHVFVEAIPAILKAHPTARILIVGGPAVNKPEYEQQLRARCEELGLTGQVLFTGIRSDVPALLTLSNVLVLPTATPEPFGLTVIEAMGARRPVVATAAGGPLDTVADGETGWLTPPNDPDAMAANIIRLLDDPEEARRMGEKGYERAHARFSVAKHVGDMARLFEECAAEGRTS